MAMNLLGLGFSFGGQDKTMSKTIENQTKHLGLMGQAVDKLDKILSINRLQTFLQAISLSRLKDVADGIENISSTGRNLTTDLESTFQSNNRTMAAFGVSVGKTGAELKKFKKETNSAAYETGISIDAMGKAFYGFEPAAQILTDLGLKGGKDFAEFAEVAGVDAEKFGWGVGQMSKQLGLSSEQMNLLVSQATKFGQTTGTLGETLNSLPDMTELFNARKALGDSPEAITSFGQQIFGLGDALFNVGIKDAGGFAKHLAKTMTDSKKSFKDLFAGTGDDLSAFQTELMVSGLAPAKVFAAMEQGPADFMKVMAEQVDELQKNGGDVGKALEFMRGRMSQTFGEEQTNLIVTALQDPVKRGTMAAIKLETDASAALGKIRKEGYESRFTAAESFERAEAMMVHRFRQISKKQSWEFVKNSQEAFKRFGTGLQKVAEEKGPLGAFVRKMSEAHQIGAQAFIPEVMRPMVTLAGSAVKEMGPMIGMLGSLGFRMNMLLNPVALVGVAIAGLVAWFAALRLEGKSTDDALAIMGVHIMNFFYGLPKKIDEALDALAGALTGSVGEPSVWKQTFEMVWGSIQTAAKHIWKRLTQLAQGFWTSFTGGVADPKSDPAVLIGAKLGDVLRNALKSAWASLKKGFSDLLSGNLTGEGALAAALGLSTILKFAGPVISVVGFLVKGVGLLVQAGQLLVPVVVKLASAFSWLLTNGPVIWEIFGAVTETLFGVSGGMALVIASLVALTAGFMLWPEKTQEAVDWVSSKLKWLSENAFELLTTGIIVAIDWVVDALSGGGEDAGKGFFESIVGWFIKLPRVIFNFFGDVVVGLGKTINGVLSMLEGLVLGALDGIKNALMKRFPASADVISNVFETVKGIVQDTFSVIKLGVTVISEIFSTVFTLAGNVVSTAFNFIAGLTGWLFDTIIFPILGKFGTLVKVVFDAVSWVVTTAVTGWGLIFTGLWVNVIKPVWDAVGPYFGAIWTGITSGLERIQDVVRSVFGEVRQITDATFGAIDTWVDGLFRNSISTDIDEDLQVALKFIENFGALAGKAFDLVTSSLNTILPASMQIGTSSEKTALPASGAPSAALPAGARDASLVDAVNRPIWYSRYERVFAQRMDRLIAAVQAGPEKKGPPRRGSRGAQAPQNPNSADLEPAVGGFY